jgi:hypothetical protein
MDFQRLALAMWEMANDLQTLRLILDDTLEEIQREISRIESLTVTDRKEFVPEHIRLCSLKSNLLATRMHLGGFKTLCHARVEECSPGIFERMADRLSDSATRSAVAPKGKL